MLKRYVEDDVSPTIYLRPNQLHTEPRFNVRLYRNSEISAAEDNRIEDLARDIESNGQIDDVVITLDRAIIAGHRRTKAIILLNQWRNKNCRSLLNVRCRYDDGTGDPRRKAIASNLQRRDISPMDVYQLIFNLRLEEKDLPEEEKHFARADSVAEYLGKSTSYVNSILKLSGLAYAIQIMMHNGELSFDTGLKILRETSNQNLQVQIVQQARIVQQENQTDKTISKVDKQKISKKKALRELVAMKHNPVKIEAPAIRQVIRELQHTNGDLRSKTALHAKRERPELLEAFTDLLRHTTDQTHIQFLEHFVNVFAPGGGTLDELRHLWLLASESN